VEGSAVVERSFGLLVKETAVDSFLQHLLMDALCRGGCPAIGKRIEVVDDQSDG
jgi:hypothetical protein